MVTKNARWETIPKDWNVVVLGEYCEISRGGSPRPIQDYLTSSCHGVNWIKIGDVSKNSKYILSTVEKIIREGVAKSRTVFCGDLILSNSMSFGRPYILKIDGCIHDGWLVIQNYQSAFDKEYLYYCLGSEFTIQQYISMAAGSSVQNLNKDKVAAVLIAKPTIQEQTAIAEALSDVDSLISSLQKLIEKKKAIKQGTMQELLTGKKRLPGFNGEWKNENLTELVQKQNGIKIGPFGSQLRKEYLVNIGEFKVFGQENVYTRDFKLGTRFLSKERYMKLKSCELLPGDFVISSMGTVGKCAIIPLNIQNGIMDSHLIRLRFNHSQIAPKYILQLFSDTIGFLGNQIEKLSVGGIMDGLSTKIVQSLNVSYPADIAEQEAIFSLLDDMDTEIEQLEKKLSKCQQIKQGMMQELLTGRIRLVDTGDNEQLKTQKIQEKQPQPAHNQHFDDAVMIAGIVNAFYSEKYPLGRKKVQKLLYLVRRKEQADVSAFHKKAAGPYADEVRYKGGEPIAQKNRYIQIKRSDKGSCFEKGTQMQQALSYLQDWEKQADITWLVSQFQYTGVNELELLATVDMAMCDLRLTGKEISVTSIKDLIRSNKEWRDKLNKTYFSDADIRRAIKRCQELFVK